MPSNERSAPPSGSASGAFQQSGASERHCPDSDPGTAPIRAILAAAAGNRGRSEGQPEPWPRPGPGRPPALRRRRSAAGGWTQWRGGRAAPAACQAPCTEWQCHGPGQSYSVVTVLLELDLNGPAGGQGPTQAPSHYNPIMMGVAQRPECPTRRRRPRAAETRD